MSWKTDRSTPWVLVGLTVLALAVRVPGLDGGLWNDEISSVLESFRTPFPAMFTEYPGDNKHPLYSHLAHVSILAFGETNWAIRLPALLFGVACIPMLYVFALPIVGRREALLSSLLLALSYHHVWFSQSARAYIILAFAALVTTHLLLKALRQNSAAAAAGFAVGIALGVYANLSFVFFVLAQFLVALLAMLLPSPRRARWQMVLLPFVAGGLLNLALYAPMLTQIREYFNTPSPMADYSDAFWAVTEAIRVLRTGLGDQFGLGLVVLGVCAFVGGVGVVSLLRRDREVGLLTTLPIVVITAGSLATRGAVYPRFFFLLSGFLVLLAVHGAFATAELVARLAKGHVTRARLDAVATAAVLLLIAVSAMSLPRNWRIPKQDFDGAMAFLDTQAQPGDVVVTADVTAKMYRRYYQRDWRVVSSVADLESLQDSVPGTLWLVYTFPNYLALLDSALEARVDRECRTERVFPATLGGGEVIVCTFSRGSVS